MGTPESLEAIRNRSEFIVAKEGDNILTLGRKIGEKVAEMEYNGEYD